MDQPYRLIGATTSPYSVKMRALMRYRRLPFVWELRSPANMEEMKAVKPQVIPYLQYPDGTVRNDSTPLAYDLEKRHTARSIIPDDPALALISHLLEDMADEWGTKYMFHYRWYYPADRQFCSFWIASERMRGQSWEAITAEAKRFEERQVGRMGLVGCTDENRDAIERAYVDTLRILEARVKESPYLLGGRAGLADFGWFGQMYQCSRDPTPAAVMRAEAPTLVAWLERLDDASGDSGDWMDLSRALPESLKALLRQAGDVYIPFLLANAEALAAGKSSFTFHPNGLHYSQGTFSYQVKCLRWLRDEFAALDGAARERVVPILRDAGCLEALSAG